MSNLTNEGSLLVVGPYYDEEIVRKRRLPSRNAASSRRMRNLCGAFGHVVQSIDLLSSASSMRLGRSCKWYRSESSKVGNLRIIFAGALGVPYLASVFSLPSVVLQAFRLFRRNDYCAVVLYNYLPYTIAVGIIGRFFYRTPVVLDIEDVCIPRLSDWRSGNRPWFQIGGWIMLNLAVWVSSSLMFPCERLKGSRHWSRKGNVIRGCIKEEEFRGPISCRPMIDVLYAGSLTIDNGAEIVINLLNSVALPGVHLHVCGFGPESERIRESISGGGFQATYHGTLDDLAYFELLDRCNVCLVLQDPNGRNCDLKTPSKVYEYFAKSKAVIATDVGDLGVLPKDSVRLLKDYDSESLREALASLDRDTALELGFVAHNYARAHWHEAVVAQDLGSLLVSLKDD